MLIPRTTTWAQRIIDFPHLTNQYQTSLRWFSMLVHGFIKKWKSEIARASWILLHQAECIRKRKTEESDGGVWSVYAGVWRSSGPRRKDHITTDEPCATRLVRISSSPRIHSRTWCKAAPYPQAPRIAPADLVGANLSCMLAPTFLVNGFVVRSLKLSYMAPNFERSSSTRWSL